MTTHPIEDHLEYFNPEDLPAQARYRLTDCYRKHYRELCALLMDAHTRMTMIEGSAKGALGALEYAQQEMDLMAQIAALLSCAQDIDAEREAA